MNTGIQGNNMTNGGSFLMGLITGSAIGTGLAIYFAPRLALELRQRLTDSMTGLRNATSERFEGIAARVADVADHVTQSGQTARDGVADAVARGAHEVGRGAREVVRGAREFEQFVRTSKTDPGAERS